MDYGCKMRSLCVVFLAVVSLGCTPSPASSAKPLGCSTNISELTMMNLTQDRVVFDDACTYEVTKHAGDAACAADDITINMTATVVAEPQPTKVKVGLVYTMTSPDRTGKFTTDPTQLCN